MAHYRGYTHTVHISKLNKKLLTACKKELMSVNPEFEGMKISDDKIMTSLIRYYLGLKYYAIKSEAENELDLSGK